MKVKKKNEEKSTKKNADEKLKTLEGKKSLLENNTRILLITDGEGSLNDEELGILREHALKVDVLNQQEVEDRDQKKLFFT